MNWETLLKFCRSLQLQPSAFSLYGYGYFEYAGRQWLTILSPQDIFALTWQGLPSFVIGYVLGVFGTTGRGVRFPTKERLAKWRFAATTAFGRLQISVYKLVVPFSPLIGIVFFNTLPAWADPLLLTRWVAFPLLISAMWLFGAFRLQDDDFREKYTDIFRYMVVPLFFVFCFGVIDGADNIAAYDTNIALKTGRSVCVATLYLRAQKASFTKCPKGIARSRDGRHRLTDQLHHFCHPPR